MDNIIVGELVGTAILILLGDGVVANVLLNKSKGQNSGWIVITLGWGLAVAIAVWVAGPFTGAHINPAVTLGFAFEGTTEWGDVPQYLIGQYLGAFIGATLVFLAYYLHWDETEDPGLKLAVFCTGPAVRNPALNLVTEIIGTFILVFGIYGIINPDGGLGVLAPLSIGLLVLGIGLSLGGPTGYAINPARDLGPRIMHAVLPIPGKGDSDWSYAWIPVVGPIIGGVLAAVLAGAWLT
ncbi:MAG: MIP/aquaporin family protein [Acidimicrobiales bacterium]